MTSNNGEEILYESNLPAYMRDSPNVDAQIVRDAEGRVIVKMPVNFVFMKYEEFKKYPNGKFLLEFGLFQNDIVRTICQLREIGATDGICADRAGIGLSTLREWLRKGRDALIQLEQGNELNPREASYFMFYRLYQEAGASVKEKSLKTLYDLVDAGDGISARWILERIGGFNESVDININTDDEDDELVAIPESVDIHAFLKRMQDE